MILFSDGLKKFPLRREIPALKDHPTGSSHAKNMNFFLLDAKYLLL
jgi:hypothetical protein